MTMEIKKKVVVAMSGGVDSSVAAALLVHEGHEVIGITIKTHSYDEVGGNVDQEGTCCSLDGINDARRVALLLGFPHYVIDLSAEFHDRVIDNFVGEYLRGRTPNPCVVCNRTIKWGALLKKAEALGADALATGHYARVRSDERTGRYVLARGRDSSKDQSYALWGLSQDFLRKTIFPLAEKTKQDVRALAAGYGLPNASKGESFEICFVADNDYTRFLREAVPGLESRVEGGDLIADGRVVGTHRGYPFYTIGQRKGLGFSSHDPLYVTGIDAKTNTVTLGRGEELLHGGLIATDVNLMKYESMPEPVAVTAKIRYKDAGSPATAFMDSGGRLVVNFDEPRRAITPGQSVVLYEGDDLVGGGIIDTIL